MCIGLPRHVLPSSQLSRASRSQSHSRPSCIYIPSNHHPHPHTDASHTQASHGQSSRTPPGSSAEDLHRIFLVPHTHDDVGWLCVVNSCRASSHVAHSAHSHALFFTHFANDACHHQLHRRGVLQQLGNTHSLVGNGGSRGKPIAPIHLVGDQVG